MPCAQDTDKSEADGGTEAPLPAPLTVALQVQGTVPKGKALGFQLISVPPSALTATCSYPKMHEGDDTPISTSKQGADR